MNRKDILNKSLELTSGSRNADYGDPTQNHQGIANIFNAIKGQKNFLTAEDIVLIQLATKLNRQRTSPMKEDHYVDLAAYSAILGEVVSTCTSTTSTYDQLTKGNLKDV